MKTPARRPALEAAHVLAEALRDTEVIRAFMAAEKSFRTDPGVEEMRGHLMAAYEAYQRAERGGTATTEHIQEVRRRQATLQAHPAAAEYVRKREAGALFLQRVNQEISSLLGVDFGATAGLAGGGCCPPGSEAPSQR